MRATQIRGLTSEATQFLQDNCVKEPLMHCPHCDGAIGERLKSEAYADATHLGMFDDGPMLHRYQLVDGGIAEEVEQETPWSSGPCIFLQLEVNGERKFPWPQTEIDEA